MLLFDHISQSAKKIVLVLTTSTSMTETSIETDSALAPIFEAFVLNYSTLALKHMPCIHYSMRFKKDQNKT